MAFSSNKNEEKLIEKRKRQIITLCLPFRKKFLFEYDNILEYEKVSNVLPLCYNKNPFSTNLMTLELENEKKSFFR